MSCRDLNALIAPPDSGYAIAHDDRKDGVVSAPHHCGHCQRPILGGDAYQCASCNTLYHAACWAENKRCDRDGSTSSRVVHVGRGGRLEEVTPTAPPTRPPHTSRTPSQGPSRATPSRPSRTELDPMASADLELECPHCMLPIDSLEAPCPFCGRMPGYGKNVLVIDGNDVPATEAPWGIQTIALLDRLLGLFGFISAIACLIPLVAEGELAYMIMSACFTSFGYLFWRLGGGLLKRKSWARTTQTVTASLFLFGIPIGTLIGALSLWGLHSEKADKFYTKSQNLQITEE